MAEEYSRVLVQSGIAALLDNGNFAKTETSCVETLSNVFTNYIRMLFREAGKSAENGVFLSCNRS
jgi:hypothetical protein